MKPLRKIKAKGMATALVWKLDEGAYRLFPWTMKWTGYEHAYRHHILGLLHATSMTAHYSMYRRHHVHQALPESFCSKLTGTG